MARQILRGCWRYPNLILAAILSGILVVTSSCGDFQDPAPDSSPTGTSQADTKTPGFQEILRDQTAQTYPNSTPSSSDTSGMVTSTSIAPQVRIATFGWDPTPDAFGYKVHLKSLSVSAQAVIDTGQATTLDLALRVGQLYAFTVTAYNGSGESPYAPHVVFLVGIDKIVTVAAD